MVRTRTHEAAVVGVLAALATFCALEARGGQPSTVVGQSTAKTAATGRRPIAERIKAANRPIRLTAEAELAPDEGLIRDLAAGDGAPKREWPAIGPVLEVVESYPDSDSATDSGPQVPAEPAVVPPPGDDAIAANPTTADDAGLVGEVAGIAAADEPITDRVTDTVGDDTVGDDISTPDTVADDTVADDTPTPTTAPRPVPAVRQAPPRRTTVPVTPQRREALLGRLRAALAEMPRPFGLLPSAEPRPAPRMPRPQSPRQPAPIALATVPAALEPAPAEPAAPMEGGAEATEAGTAEAALAVEAVPVETSLADPSPAVVVDAPATEAAPEAVTVTEAVVTEAVVTEAVGETSADDRIADAGDTPAVAESGTDVGAEHADDGDREATPTDVAATAPPVVSRAAPPTAPRPMVRANPPRTRAPHSIVHRPRPFERLQATLDSMPRPLGILPAPRPEMHAATGPRRGSSAPQRVVARSSTRHAPPVGTPSAPVAAEPVVAEPKEAEMLVSAPEAAPVEADPIVDVGQWPADEGEEEVAGTEMAEPETDGTLARTEPSDVDAGGDDAPGAFPAEESIGGDTAPEAVACIEVTVEGPEDAIERGSDVTLHLTVRNTGSAPARAVAPVFHFSREIEPKAIAGRDGTLTERGTVVVEALAELRPGESIDVDVVATCHEVGTARFQGVVWCGEGDSAEQVPVDGELHVVPARIATAPEGRSRR